MRKRLLEPVDDLRQGDVGDKENGPMNWPIHERLLSGRRAQRLNRSQLIEPVERLLHVRDQPVTLGSPYGMVVRAQGPLHELLAVDHADGHANGEVKEAKDDPLAKLLQVL